MSRQDTARAPGERCLEIQPLRAAMKDPGLDRSPSATNPAVARPLVPGEQLGVPCMKDWGVTEQVAARQPR